MAINDSVKNALICGGGFNGVKTNVPKQYNGKQTEYFGVATETHVAEYAKYSSDFVKAEYEYARENGESKWHTVYIRMANARRPSASDTYRMDDYKNVLFADRPLEYVPLGAKIRAMGSVWLVINPDNLSSVGASAIVQKCNAEYRYLDYYGNVKKEPIAVDRGLAMASALDIQTFGNINKGYFNMKCQYNEATAQIDTNTRVILGSSAYRVTGYSDFNREFTGDESSVRLLEYSIRADEIQPESDDMVKGVANGKTFEWDIYITGAPIIKVGQTAQFSAASVRENETVESSEEYPIDYLWESSDESVARVDADGNVTGVSEGTCLIRATLKQNESIKQEFEIEVEGVNANPHVEFVTTVPAAIKQYGSAVIGAAYFVNGAKTADTVSFTLSGAEKNCYTLETAGNSIVISVFKASDTPLEITASCNGESVTANIVLEGI